MDQVQLRAKARIIVEEGAFARGEAFWTNEKRARLYIAQDVAEPIGAAVVEQRGPGKDAAEKKPSSAAPAGPSTDSPRSSVLGAARSLFASAVDLVLPDRKSKPSGRGGRRNAAKGRPAA